MKVCLACGHRFVSEEWRCPLCGRTPGRLNGFWAFAPDLAEANDGFAGDFFESLADLEAGNFWFRARNRLVCWALRRHFPEASSFLEIGCGTGFVLSGIRREFPHWRLCGSEMFHLGLAFAEKRVPGVSLLQMDARRIPFEEEFDVIGAFDVLEHIEEDEAVLHQLRQATRPGGGIVLTVPQHRFLWSRVDEYSFHKRRYTRKELVEKVVRAGFEVRRVTSFVFFLLPVMLLSRLRQHGRQGRFDPLAEYRLPRFADIGLERIMEMERGLIERGVSFPVGGSLLVLAGRR